MGRKGQLVSAEMENRMKQCEGFTTFSTNSASLGQTLKSGMTINETLLAVYKKHPKFFNIRCICGITIQLLNHLERINQQTQLINGCISLTTITADLTNFQLKIFAGSTKHARSYVCRSIIAEPLTERQKVEYSEEVLKDNPYFCSINTHKGKGGNRSDDLESVFYVIFYLIRGHLPWLAPDAPINPKEPPSEQKLREILINKNNLSHTSTYRTLPGIFKIFYNYVRKVKPFEAPDYA